MRLFLRVENFLCKLNDVDEKGQSRRELLSVILERGTFFRSEVLHCWGTSRCRSSVPLLFFTKDQQKKNNNSSLTLHRKYDTLASLRCDYVLRLQRHQTHDNKGQRYFLMIVCLCLVRKLTISAWAPYAQPGSMQMQAQTQASEAWPVHHIGK